MAVSGDQDNVFVIIGQLYFNQFIVFTQTDRAQAGFADIGVFQDRCLFYDPFFGSHKQIFAFSVVLNRNQGCDLFAWLQLQDIDNRRPSGCAARFRYFIAFHAVNASGVGKKHQVMVGSRHQKVFDVVVLDGLHPLNAAPAAVLAAEIVHAHPLDIAKLCHRNNRIRHRNHICHGQIHLVITDRGPSFIAVFVGNQQDFFADDAEQLFLI